MNSFYQRPASMTQRLTPRTITTASVAADPRRSVGGVPHRGGDAPDGRRRHFTDSGNLIVAMLETIGTRGADVGLPRQPLVLFAGYEYGDIGKTIAVDNMRYRCCRPGKTFLAG